MRKLIWLLLVIPLSNCQEISESKQMYADYLQLNRRYWSRVDNLKFHSLHNYFEGDTLTLTPELSFLMIPNDTITEIAIEPENFFEVSKPTEILINKTFETSGYRKVYEFKTLNLDSNLVGTIMSDEIITNLEGIETLIDDKDYMLTKVYKLEEEYENQIKDLANKNNITVDSLYQLLTKEHFRETGERIFSY